MTDIDGMDPHGAMGQQHIGKPAGGCADIQAHQPRGRKAERRQPLSQLQPAARNPRVVLPAHLQRGLGADRLAGLGDALGPGEHLAGEDQRLGARA